MGMPNSPDWDALLGQLRHMLDRTRACQAMRVVFESQIRYAYL